MEISSAEIAAIVKKVISGMGSEVASENGADVPIGVSNRHVHLSREHLDVLFGAGYELTKAKDLSQPGQYAANEVVTIVGPSLRPIEKVRVLGPIRPASQVEISMTDSYVLKVKPPVRESGKIEGSAPITMIGPKGVVTLTEGCIIANRHIHMGIADAEKYNVADGDYVTVDVQGKGKRSRWYDVQVRVNKNFALEMHVDTDDANAAGIGNGSLVKIVKE